MSATVHSFPLPQRSSTERPTRDKALRALGAVLVMVALFAALMHGAGSETRALRRLPVEERSALYARTMENLATVCRGDGKLFLSDFCQEQARLALAFPECDTACTEVARAALHTPTR